MSQLAFDLDLKPSEPVCFDRMQDVKTGHCSYCLRPLKGRYSQCSGGVGPDGWTAKCDDCIREANAAYVAALPFRECGIHKVGAQGEQGHCEDCLDFTCIWCGEQESNAFLVSLNHSPEALISTRDRICMKQRNAARRAGVTL